MLNWLKCLGSLTLLIAACSQDAASTDTDAGALLSDAGQVQIDSSSKLPGDAAVKSPDMTPVFGGQCDPNFSGVATNSWSNGLTSTAIAAMGHPNHRVRDVIKEPGAAAPLVAHFSYGGIVDKSLEKETVQAWIRLCPDWQSWGTLTTDTSGEVSIDIPVDLPVGEYQVRFLVNGDATFAEGVIAVWPSGTRVVVSDMDGTLTTSDTQMWSDIFLGNTAAMYTDADSAMQAWVAKGYRIFYLTGRPERVTRYSRNWLETQGFPSGPMQHTTKLSEELPFNSGVGNYKKNRLLELNGQGVSWRAAYGNATTDIYAYAGASISTADTYIIGTNGGQGGTQALDSTTAYTPHLAVIAGYPDAVQPW